ncbi:uncharacterized protein LOC111949036 [Oryzias latipes]|uniref:uncharacterized protein LOC111949036 n=1 Tax=Oryzias latipes TaxID=8090 RepID=UPI000CE262B3|nr:uncharacterized protein LOC111949036 [Oryzias latipes]
MLSVQTSVFTLLLLVIGTDVSCEELTAVKKEESTLEGTSVTLSYKYPKLSRSDSYFWYRQFPGNLSDSLEDGITASRAEVFSSEELTVTLSCNYSVKANNLQWYRQDPGSAPRFLLLITDTKEPSVVEAKPPNPRLTAVLNQERNQVHLQISSAAVTDSAVYYCALEPTVTGNNTWPSGHAGILRRQADGSTKQSPMQAATSLPADLVRPVKEELTRWEQQGVISKVDQPTEWCAPMVVVVPKRTGRIIEASGVSPDPDKVKAVTGMQEPNNVSGVRRFLGMANHLAEKNAL